MPLHGDEGNEVAYAGWSGRLALPSHDVPDVAVQHCLHIARRLPLICRNLLHGAQVRQQGCLSLLLAHVCYQLGLSSCQRLQQLLCGQCAATLQQEGRQSRVDSAAEVAHAPVVRRLYGPGGVCVMQPL